MTVGEKIDAKLLTSMLLNSDRAATSAKKLRRERERVRGEICGY
jgi:hypothetical protein